MKDKLCIREVMIDEKCLQRPNLSSFWLVDYPVLAYLDYDSCTINMALLPDLNAS